jgi:hypothetical protein
MLRSDMIRWDPPYLRMCKDIDPPPGGPAGGFVKMYNDGKVKTAAAVLKRARF